MATSSLQIFNFTPIVHLENEQLNLDFLKKSYKDDRELYNTRFFGSDLRLFRLQAIPTMLFHEHLGIVPHFREKRPMTSRMIDDWIENTSKLSEVCIAQDLEILKEFLLSCDDIFTIKDDKDYVVEAMNLFLQERCMWCSCCTKKLKSVLEIY
jgi:hypothetical protein